MCHKLPGWMFEVSIALLVAIVMASGKTTALADASDEPKELCSTDEIQQQPVDFEKQIRPLILQHCSSCHGPKEQNSSLRLDARHAAFDGGDGGVVLVPGKPDDSELLRRVRSTDEDRMPPEGPPLTQTEIDLLSRWISEGANWPETDYDRAARIDPRLQHWSYQPLKIVSPPNAAIPESLKAAGITDIDRFLFDASSRKSLVPNGLADRHTLIRRLSLDLHGLPPEPGRVRAYCESDDPSAWSQLVDEMLASPRYGERWAQYWLDLVRYADTHGFEVNTPRDNAWPYRDYVIQSLNEDKPYDQFVREQIAGDLFGADAATGFMVSAAVLLPGQIGADDASKRLARQDALDEIIVGTGGTFLGITIGCARCHDHKFDPLSQEDYYAFQAFFAGVEYGDRPIRDAEWNDRVREAASLKPRIDQLRSHLSKLEPHASTLRTLIIDEQDSRATFLQTPNGPGTNPDGVQRGYRNDPGSAEQTANISNGQYTWWNNTPGTDVMYWAPGNEGQFQIWLSWGAHGSGVHTRDARYLLDLDGDLSTREDQAEIAKIDQYYPAGITEGETEQKPLWSGLQSIGIHHLNAASRIVLRGGETGTGITADVIVLQEVLTEAIDVSNGTHAERQPRLPALRAPVSPERNVESFAPTAAKYVRFTTFETINSNQHEPCIDELEVFSASEPTKNIALASYGVRPSSSGNYSDIGIHQLPHIHDGLYGNDHSWISNEQGGGWVQLEFPEVTEINRIEWGRDRTKQFNDRLPVRYEITVSADGHHWKTIAGGHDRCPHGSPYDPIQGLMQNRSENSDVNVPALVQELKSLEETRAKLETPRQVFAGIFREPDVTYLLRRGDPEQKVSETQPAVPGLFQTSFVSGGGHSESQVRTQPSVDDAKDGLTVEQARRMELANWIASPSNPLTARVIVNRIWQGHFGLGIVETPSDFGINGIAPTHPELLDWLAGELIRNGWSLKHIHRLILNSVAYRLSSEIQPHNAAIDYDNRMLWRFSSRRIEGELIRDSLLAVTGELNLEMGGPGFDFFKARGGLDGFPPVEDFDRRGMKRMIYQHKVRMEPVPVFGAFDCPDAGQAMPKRSRSTTAIQALNLMNSRFVIDRSVALAARLKADRPDGHRDQITHAFELLMSRSPSEKEMQACLEVAETSGMVMVCRALLNSSEFLFIP